jgi:cell division septation protein DedD
MRGYFDDEQKTERPRRDTELTLGNGALFGLFLGLVLLCGFCFGLGYAIGHRGAAPTVAAKAPTAAPDQEPLQGSAAIPKPSAAETAAAPPLLPGDAGAASSPAPPGDGTTANPAGTPPGPIVNAPGDEAAATTPVAGSAQVRPALPGAGYQAPLAQAGAAPNVHAALPSQALWRVQIAAVSNSADANVLSAALRQHGYSVTAAHDPADGLIHVRIGPFASRDEAIHWRDRLLGDGYNAQVQP